MKSKNIILKIALGVAIASTIFSIVNLTRSIIYGVGVPLACVLMVGTVIVLVICAVMLYQQSRYDAGEDEVEENADAAEEKAAPVKTEESRAPAAAQTSDDDIEREVDALIADPEKESSYDLSNFE